MSYKEISSESNLLSTINDIIWDYDALVVEGYDGVGKGRLLNILSAILDVTPYRPDYNLWQQYDHRPQDRWKASGFFWDIFSHFYHRNSSTPLLFDRGILSGAVYNNDMSIARDYPNLLRDMKVLHIIVTVPSEEEFIKLQEIRDKNYVHTPENWENCLEYTNRYIKALEISGLDGVIYYNRFLDSESDRLAKICEGCGHYSYGWCRHPDNNCLVDKDQPRCILSEDKEVQDRNVNEVHSM